MKDMIAKWYGQGLWSEHMVHNAVLKGVLTQTEYEEIISGKTKEENKR